MTIQYDIIALDVDGTLLDERHQLRPATREAVRRAADAGAEIVLCTGRGPSNTLPVLEELGLSGTLITHNGAATVEAEGRKVLHRFELNNDHLAPYLAYCREHGVHFDINTAFELFIEQTNAEADVMYGKYQIRPIRRQPNDPLPDGLVKFTVFGSFEQMDRVQRDWEAWDSPLQRIRSGDFFIDVQHADASKGRALEQLAKLRGVDPGRIMAIGNYYNDVGMLEYAGLGVAMGNSPDAVKSAADAVTSTNDEDGVAAALAAYLYA